ncbi:MAG: hypothetical protein JXX28_10585 [Deltaproteobacteria bacterium]|nr:hypothetical protein [Deltaproteobacteria bacterium]
MRFGPFERHLREAIAHNLARREGYAAQSGGRSRVLSLALITAERGLLPLARSFDRRGGERLEAAFAPMRGLPAPERPSTLRGRGSDAAALWGAAAVLAHLSWGVAWRLRDSAAVVDRCEEALTGLRTLEQAHQRHLAMCAHLTESVARCAALSDGSPLLRTLVAVHLLGMPLAPAVDLLAWPAQTAGVGARVNDLPRAWPPL